jgi:hypothetical protein
MQARIDELEKERDSVLQEAKISACELDTQKGIIQSVRDLFDVRVYDFNLITAIKVKLEAHNLTQQAKALNEYAYSGKPLTKRGLNLESITLSDKANKEL